jgi:hypothetical protein
LYRLRHGDNHLNVGSGPGRRVTILSYTPSGVLMKTGSIKDSRLEGRQDGRTSSIVHGRGCGFTFTFFRSKTRRRKR